MGVVTSRVPLSPPAPSLPVPLDWALCCVRSMLGGVLAMASSVCGGVRGVVVVWGGEVGVL